MAEKGVVVGRSKVGLGVILLACAYLAACSSGLSHKVRPGETLFGIAQAYRVSPQEIQRLNNLRDPNRLEVGQELRIPPPTGQTRAAASLPLENRLSSKTAIEKRVRTRATPDLPEDMLPRDRELRDGERLFRWPVEGRMASGFGVRNGSSHDGIDITAPRGTPIYAAADGEVIFSDVLHGYGKIVIVRHRHGYVTVYAHNQRNFVKEGQVVRQGQVLAEVGQSGRASGPHLHFEIRKDNLAQNPLYYLPEERRTVFTDR